MHDISRRWFWWPIGTLLACSLPAQGSFTTYGTGCRGTGLNTSPCIQVNAGSTGNTGNTTTSGWYYLEIFNAGQNLTVNGFEMLARVSSVTPQIVKTGIFLLQGSPPTFMQIASGSMSVGPGASKRYATFTTPAVPILNNTFFYVGFQSTGSSTFHPVASTGSPTTFYSGTPPIPSTGRFAWNVLCTSGPPGAVPQIAATGVPTIGNTFSIDLSRAKASTPTALVLGIMKLNLMIPGTPNCLLLSQDNLVLSGGTDLVGRQSVSVLVPMGLVGQVFFAQYLIVDAAANQLGVVTSDGGQGTIG